MSGNPDDTRAWSRALDGDGEAFGELFDRHRDRIVRHSRRLVASSHDVDDVVAITFLEAWRRRDRVRLVEGSVLPWLLVTATYSAQNLSRGIRRHRSLLQRLPVEGDAPDHSERMEGGPAYDALNALPLIDRQVLVLCVLEGFSTNEAAEALGVPPGTVKSRLSRAKQRLARRMSPQRHLTTEPEEAK
jgi:RNA polymerase sigma-70 factor (ECF subfamily)